MELAHISDVHVKVGPTAARPRLREYANKRWIGGLNLLVKRKHDEGLLEAAVADLRADPPDHLAITGDVSNLALDGEFLRFREHLEELGLPPERVSLIPGNHDTYTRGAYRGRRFEAIFADWVGGADQRWPRAQRSGDVLIVSTSSCVPTPWFTAHGFMGREQLAEVQRLLVASEAAFKLVLVHHPPLLGTGRPDNLLRRNRDGAALLRACQVGGAKLVLCGHTHQPFEYTLDPDGRPVQVVCAGSTTYPVKALGIGGTYNRYTIEEGALRAIEVRAYDADRGAFTVLRREEQPVG